MSYLEHDEREQQRLNEFVHGKRIREIDFRGINGDIAICFNDGSEVVISHLGGMEIEALRTDE